MRKSLRSSWPASSSMSRNFKFSRSLLARTFSRLFIFFLFTLLLLCFFSPFFFLPCLLLYYLPGREYRAEEFVLAVREKSIKVTLGFFREALIKLRARCCALVNSNGLDFSFCGRVILLKATVRKLSRFVGGILVYLNLSNASVICTLARTYEEQLMHEYNTRVVITHVPAWLTIYTCTMWPTAAHTSSRKLTMQFRGVMHSLAPYVFHLRCSYVGWETFDATESTGAS